MVPPVPAGSLLLLRCGGCLFAFIAAPQNASSPAVRNSERKSFSPATLRMLYSRLLVEFKNDPLPDGVFPQPF